MFCCSGSVLFSLIWCFLDAQSSNNLSFDCHIKYSTFWYCLIYYIFKPCQRDWPSPPLSWANGLSPESVLSIFSLHTFPRLSVAPEGCWLARSQQGTTSYWRWEGQHIHILPAQVHSHTTDRCLVTVGGFTNWSYQYISVLSCCGNYSQENEAYSLNFTLHQFRTNCFMKPIRKYLFTDTFLWTRIFVFPYYWLEFLFHPDPPCPSLDR